MPGELLSVPRVVQLVTAGKPVVPPPGLVYSSGPESSHADDAKTYIVKGPDVPMVAAELAAHGLAVEVGLRVPPFALANSPKGALFASETQKDVLRDPSYHLKTYGKAIARVIAFDVWLFNNDRNMGGLLIDAEGVIAIDFEKSHAIRQPMPLTGLAALEPRTLWPSGALGAAIVGEAIPVGFIEKVQAIPDAAIESVLSGVETVLPAYTWRGATMDVLIRRRDRLLAHAKEIWK